MDIQEIVQSCAPNAPRALRISNARRAPRLQAKRYLLTWSQTGGITMQDMTMLLAAYETTYKVYCQEDHKDTEGKHFHAVLLLKNKPNTTNFDYFKILEHNADIKPLKTMRDVRNAISYVKKDGNWLEEGERPEEVANMKRREKYDMVKTKSLNECIDSGMFSFSEIRSMPVIKMWMMDKWPKFKKRQVKWFHGPTGSGKTRRAVQELDEKCANDWTLCVGDCKQFIDYNGQRGIIFDDLRPGSIQFNKLLNLLDGYPVNCRVLGAWVPWMAEYIYITAPTEPSEMYVNHETGVQWDNLDQLLRRIDCIVKFPIEEDKCYDVSDTEELE